MIDERVDELVGANIRQLRIAAGLSQGQLASKLGESYRQQTLLKIEKGSRPLRLTEAAVLAQVLDTTVDALLNPPADTAVELKLYAAADDVVGLWRHVRANCRALTESKAALEEVVAEHPGVYVGEQVAGVIEMARTCTIETAVYGGEGDDGEHQ